jgi:hypothetical protein
MGLSAALNTDPPLAEAAYPSEDRSLRDTQLGCGCGPVTGYGLQRSDNLLVTRRVLRVDGRARDEMLPSA